MLKFFATLFALCVLANPAFGSTLGPLTPREQGVVGAARRVAVEIKVDASSTFDAITDSAICSGTVVGFDEFRSDLIVLTARHCVNGDDEGVTIKPTHVTLENGDEFAVDKVYESKAADLAFIEAKAPRYFYYTYPQAKFADDEVAQGEGVFFYGMPAGTPWALQFARGSQGPMFNSTPDYSGSAAPLFAIDCPNCGPGDSGAAVFDENGRIKGVLVMGRQAPEMILYVPLAIVKIAYNTFLHTR
ncbi:MAG: trypsin-like peptidase domain-containing protein [Patescibacteria group bacterium]|nr:trypsin-like peptidase domain-containing protein [Patescibacteria group bacterium]